MLEGGLERPHLINKLSGLWEIYAGHDWQKMIKDCLVSRRCAYQVGSDEQNPDKKLLDDPNRHKGSLGRAVVPDVEISATRCNQADECSVREMHVRQNAEHHVLQVQ